MAKQYIKALQYLLSHTIYKRILRDKITVRADIHQLAHILTCLIQKVSEMLSLPCSAFSSQIIVSRYSCIMTVGFEKNWQCYHLTKYEKSNVTFC